MTPYIWKALRQSLLPLRLAVSQDPVVIHVHPAKGRNIHVSSCFVTVMFDESHDTRRRQFWSVSTPCLELSVEAVDDAGFKFSLRIKGCNRCVNWSNVKHVTGLSNSVGSIDSSKKDRSCLHCAFLFVSSTTDMLQYLAEELVLCSLDLKGCGNENESGSHGVVALRRSENVS